ncbi:MAG: hypothetical protein P4L77_02870 [Sulfuriferula sp.]|nr:hypothetical protein [Sulfuriferula sp.]
MSISTTSSIVASASTASTTKTYDKMDTNKDGTVTTAEEQSYKLKHPAATTADKSPATDKGAAANTNAETQKLGSNIDVTA